MSDTSLREQMASAQSDREVEDLMPDYDPSDSLSIDEETGDLIFPWNASESDDESTLAAEGSEDDDDIHEEDDDDSDDDFVPAKRFKDTQAAFHESRQEVAELRERLARLEGMAQAGKQKDSRQEEEVDPAVEPLLEAISPYLVGVLEKQLGYPPGSFSQQRQQSAQEQQAQEYLYALNEKYPDMEDHHEIMVALLEEDPNLSYEGAYWQAKLEYGTAPDDESDPDYDDDESTSEPETPNQHVRTQPSETPQERRARLTTLQSRSVNSVPAGEEKIETVRDALEAALAEILG